MVTLRTLIEKTNSLYVLKSKNTNKMIWNEEQNVRNILMGENDDTKLPAETDSDAVWDINDNNPHKMEYLHFDAML